MKTDVMYCWPTFLKRKDKILKVKGKYQGVTNPLREMSIIKNVGKFLNYNFSFNLKI